MSEGPARGYSWEPFREGNTASRRHGAYSEREIGPLAAEIQRAHVERAPWLRPEAFRGAVLALARAESVCELLWCDLVENGVVDEDGAPRTATNALDRWEARAARLRADLGLNPRAWANLLRDFSAATTDPTEGIDELRRIGREVLAERELREGST